MNASILFTIYDHPKDYPDFFVVRQWEADANGCRPKAWFRIGKTIEAVREYLPFGVTLIGRDPSDDPVIAETWIL